MKYVLGVFGIIVLLLLIVILIVRSGPDKPAGDVQTGRPQISLAAYEDKPAIVSMTVRGDVTADEKRRAIKISASRQERVIEILEGYDEQVVSRQSYPNNDDAYKIFLSALANAGFEREKESTVKDERGACPFGRRYVYRLQNGSDLVHRAWSTSCRREHGTFGGNTNVVRRLFEQQVPDYQEATRGVRL